MYNWVWYFCTYLYGLSLNGWHALFGIVNNRHGVTIMTHAIKRHFLIWMTMVRQPTKRRCSCVLTCKCTFICVDWWTRQRIHNTLIVVGRYLRLMGDETIPDAAEPRLESFNPPLVTGIDLPHQGVVDSYNLQITQCCYNISLLTQTFFLNKYAERFHRRTQIARFMDPPWAHLGPVGPRWAPCWPHESCIQG